MLRQRDGRYRLTYSIGAWTNDTYRVVQAVSDRVAGPFVESDRVLMNPPPRSRDPATTTSSPAPMASHGWCTTVGIQR
jgi:hypothetical protein